MTKTFERDAPWAMKRLMQDFGFNVLDAAAVMGNAGHESGGLEKLQEIKPTVAGSRGGYGWFQWTGPRRRAFEAYCARNSLDPKSREANYAFLYLELKGPEKAAIAKTKAARSLEEKTKAFELGFERAGIKHYPSRYVWARKAYELYTESPESNQVPLPPVEASEAPQEALPEAPATPVAQPKETPLVGFLRWLRSLLK